MLNGQNFHSASLLFHILAPGPVSNLEANYDMDSFIVKLNWDPPKDSNGILIGYDLHIYRQEPSLLLNIKLSNGSTNYAFNVTRFCRNSIITLSAFTSIGSGPPINISFSAIAPGLYFILSFIKIGTNDSKQSYITCI